MSYNLLCIDDDPEFLFSIKLILKKKYNVLTTTSLADGLQEVKGGNIDLVLLDITLGCGESGLNGLRQIKQLSPETDVVMVTGARDPKLVVQAIRAGATDYLCKPFANEELTAVIEKHRVATEVRDRNKALIRELNPLDTRSRILGSSPSFRALLEKTAMVKGHDANILIQGESGTGKELLARYIHSLEKNSRRPFIAVNCAAIPEGLMESELFGHERGAFTGAHHRKVGKFELASGGDIFLDEISALHLDLQAKILRVLQEKEIVRVGGNTPISVNFRVISATNEDLNKKVANGRFRVDLYHRLRVVELQIPPLRERREDITLLIAYFLNKFGNAKNPKKISAEALRKLQEHQWPGNVRELENVIHSLTILSSGDVITEHDLPKWLTETFDTDVEVRGIKDDSETLKLPADLNRVTLKDFVREAERIYIKKVLQMNGGDKSKTAASLNIGRTTLYSKLKELNLLN